MGVIQRIKKPTTRKGKKVLQSRESKPVEGPKQCIFLQARNPSERARKVLKDIYNLKKPDAAYLSRKNDFVPFEDATLIEKLCYKKEASLFGVSSHSKKRPHNIILGRTFNHNILDMIELGADNFKAMSEFHNIKVLAGIKPCLLFNGPVWDLNQDFKRLKSLFTDYFCREKIETIRLQGVEHVLSFTASDDGSIYLRSYRILLKKSGQRTPRIELEEIETGYSHVLFYRMSPTSLQFPETSWAGIYLYLGPSIDFKLRRTKLASDDLYKEACRVPREVKPVAKKNLSRDAFGTKFGRIHMGKQDIQRLQTRKMKGLKKTPEEKKQMLLKRRLAKKAAKQNTNIETQ